MLSGAGEDEDGWATPDATEDLTPAFIRELFEPWAGARGVLAAVSGGPDSMAMLHMLAAWSPANGQGPKIAAATVDHGLRPEAAAEAAAVCRFAGKLGIDCANLRWDPPAGLTGVQEAARDARYGLLVNHARETGADVLMTAHHADDQAETVLFRLLRGTGIGGLAGMRALSERDGLALARPLLGLPKQVLVDYCRREGISYVHDPSNADMRFARTRMRRMLPLMAEEGMDVAGWSRLAERAARADQALAVLSARTAGTLVQLAGGDTIRIDFARLAEEPEEIVLRVVAAQVATVAGEAASSLRLGRLESAVERLLEARSATERLVLTLADARLELRRDGTLSVTKAPPRRVNG